MISAEPEVASPFAGVWAGDWAGRYRQGTMHLTIGEDGKVVGTTTDAQAVKPGMVSGRVLENGTYTYEYKIGIVYYSGRATFQTGEKGLEMAFTDFQNGAKYEVGTAVLHAQTEPAQQA